MFNCSKKITLVFMMWCTGLAAYAQEAVTDTAATTDFMRSNGKIYVVVAIVLTILAGLFLYVARLDKKISRLEKGDI